MRLRRPSPCLRGSCPSGVEQWESGKWWVSEQLSALAAAEGVDLTAIECRVDLDGTYWIVVRTSHATLREGFRERDLEDLPADVWLKT